MNPKKVVFLSFALMALVSLQVYALTEVGGDITEDTIWGPNSPTVPDVNYLVTSDVTVRNSATLTIEPGVTIKFEAWEVGLFIGQYGNPGSLYAMGTADNEIVFTVNSDDPDDMWWGIEFDGENQVSPMLSVMDDCIVERASYSWDSIYCYYKCSVRWCN